MEGFELNGCHDVWYRDRAYKVITDDVLKRLKIQLDGSEINFQIKNKMYNAVPLKNWKRITHGRIRQHA